MPMYKALTTYGAVTAKVRAMYGRMLSEDDWAALGQARNLSDAVALVRSSPGWAEAAEQIPQGCRDVRLVEHALQRQVENEYERIYKFAMREDKRFLVFLAYRTEYRRILAAMRHVITPRVPSPDPIESGSAGDKVSERSRALASAQTFQDVLAAMEGSIYEPVLRAMPQNPSYSDYSKAHILLENCYYSAVWRFITKKYTGIAKAKLRDSIGREADFLNLMHIMRLRRSFPESLKAVHELLIPVRYKLTDEFIDRLIACQTDDEAVNLLRSSRWGEYFKDKSLAATDHSYELMLESFSRRQIHAAVPGICVPQAYLTLKGIECDKLIRAVEAAQYGMTPSKVI
jgi:vacuolar-type H+-ATPase subunit C/Vma6